MLEQTNTCFCTHVLKACKKPFTLVSDVFREIIDIVCVICHKVFTEEVHAVRISIATTYIDIRVHF